MKQGRPLILSASRRTDLPGFHSKECADRIRLRARRLRTRPLAGVVFWTKHVDGFLPRGELHNLVCSELENPVINLTITGLGGTVLEPGTPSSKHVISRLPEVIEVFKGEPWRIRWRFDPILKGHTTLDAFFKIAEIMSRSGVLTCTFSFPSYRSLKGDLTPQFTKAGIPKWQKEEQEVFLRGMLKIATEFGIALLSCSQPSNTEVVGSVRPAQCIPFDVLKRGFPEEELSRLSKDYSQRTHCTCIESEDIGDYESDACLGGCVYCYSRACV